MQLREPQTEPAPDAMADKLRGGYYTPSAIAEFLAGWAVRDPRSAVLEPSCGDGGLLEAAARRVQAPGFVTGVELFPSEAAKAAVRGGDGARMVAGDAFDWYARARPDQTYDAVVGNPPFIRYQSWPERYREPAFALMRDAGLSPSRLTNAWVPFIVLATRALRPGGRLAMVVPAELLQVTYAGELREYLARTYSHLTLVTFRRLVFDGVQQEVVLLLATRQDCARSDIAFVELDSPDDLSVARLGGHPPVEVDLDHAREKWTQYYLSPAELALIRQIESSGAFPTLGALAEVDVGIVTGRNECFVLTPGQADDLGVREYCLPLVGRSAQIPGLELTRAGWRRLERDDGRCLLLQLGSRDLHELTPAARAYVEDGERRGWDAGYKCRIRKPRWWHVPSVWVPDGFLLRQIHDAPRIVANSSGATCTDTIHRVRTRGARIDALAAASLNSMTLAFSEIRGRSYGGGVLELEPTEAERLPFPEPSGAPPLADVGQALRRSLDDALDTVDAAVLRSAGLTAAEVATLRGVWQKLVARRMARKRR